MRSIAPLSFLLLCACAGTALPRVEAPQTREPQLTIRAERPQTADEGATQRWLQQQTQGNASETRMESRPGAGKETVPFGASAPVSNDGALVRRAQTNEDASNAWLQQTADQRRADYEAGIPTQPILPQTTIERTVYVDRYAPVGYGYDCYGNPVYYSGYCRPYRSNFPVYTVTGATIGAFTSGCHASGRNIAVGAGIGLLFDIASCW